ncbi:DUF1194 domain-containing protein [Microvirga sp. P5_D2]
MLRRFWRILACLSLIVMPILPAGAEPQLDLALVLAVDISSSMESEEQTLQRTGFAEAFRSSLVHEVIRNGPAGRIAVTYVEWSGVKDQTILVPWMVIDGPEKARSFADSLSGKPTRQAGMTSISAAIDFSRELFVDVGKIAARRVIDISGDGPNNDGRRVALARDEAVAEGIVINGLPIMFARTMGSPEMDGLDAYYRECIIGGVGSFMIPLHDPEQFAMVIRTKIMREIAGLEGGPLKLVPAQATMNCVTGERRKIEDGISENRRP